MDTSQIVIWFIALCVTYIFLIRPYLLARRKFKCDRCGECCKLKVRLYPEDIIALKKAGKKDFIHGKYLKKGKEGYCIFLKFKNGKSKCTVYKNRPKICKIFPNRKGIFGKRMSHQCRSFAGKIK